MSFIYKITNDINGKTYIGKTDFSIEKRFKEHCQDAYRERNEKRPLYAAMRKYGIEHFHIELVEETDNPEEREIYCIAYYKGYEEGYNATLGGDGKRIYNHNLIISKLKECPYASDVAKEVGCSRDLVSLIAKNNSLELKNKAQEKMRKKSKEISAYTKDGEFIKKFNST